MRCGRTVGDLAHGDARWCIASIGTTGRSSTTLDRRWGLVGTRRLVLLASRAFAQAAGVIASRWPAVDKISGDLDRESAWVDKISGTFDKKSAGSDKSGASSRADEAEWMVNLW